MRDQAKQIQNKRYQFQERELYENYQKQLKNPRQLQSQEKRKNTWTNKKQKAGKNLEASQKASPSQESRRIFRNIALDMQFKWMAQLE